MTRQACPRQRQRCIPVALALCATAAACADADADNDRMFSAVAIVLGEPSLDRAGSLHRAGRRVERSHDPVAGMLYFPSAETADLHPDDMVMDAEHCDGHLVAMDRSHFRRSDDIGKHYGAKSRVVLLDISGKQRGPSAIDFAGAQHAIGHILVNFDDLFGHQAVRLAMLTGAMLEVARHRCIVVVDGFTVSVAALLATEMDARVRAHCVFSHRSAETGHRKLLEHLQAQPLLDLRLRLGEGSGAALAWPLIDSAARLMTEMASFESAGVADRQ